MEKSSRLRLLVCFRVVKTFLRRKEWICESRCQVSVKIIQSRTQNITSRIQQHQSSQTFDQISAIQRYLRASQLFLDLARPNNCCISCQFAQAIRGSCPLLCDVILAGGLGQETQVENNRVILPPLPPWGKVEKYLKRILVFKRQIQAYFYPA